MKAAEREIEAARAYLDSIIATIRQPLVVLDEELRVISASSSFHRIFSVKPEDLIGRHLLAAGDHLDVPALREFLASIQARGTTINDHEVEIELPSLGRRAFSMSARVLREEPSARRKILVAIVDVTEAKREGKALEAAKSEAERANVGKSRFLAAASHDLRQPLQTISLLQGMLEKRVHDEATLKLVHRLDETVSTMSSMLDKLLDINQLEAGIVRPAIVDFPIKRLLDELRTEFTYHTADERPRLARGPEQPHRTQRSASSRADHPQSAVERGEVHRPRASSCSAADAAVTSSASRSGTPAPASRNWSFRRSSKNSISSTIPHGNEARASVSVLPSCSALPTCSVTRSTFALVWVRARSSPSRCRLDEPERLSSPVPSQDETQESTPSRGTILIVEDDPAVLEMLQLLFDDEGHRTLVAADGHKALELAAQGSTVPDLIIADYNLPNGPQRARDHRQAAEAGSSTQSRPSS